MEKVLLKSAANDNLSTFQEWLNSMSTSEISKILDTTILRDGGNQAVPALKALMKGLPSSLVKSDPSESKRLCIFQHVIKLLKENDDIISTKLCSELTGLLILQCDVLPTGSLVELCNQFLSYIQSGSCMSGRWFELFPKLASTVCSRDLVTNTAVYPSLQMTGQGFKSQVISSLCSNSWNPKAAVHIASVLKDIALSSEELENVLRKIFSLFSHLGYQEIPPLAYQLLLLAINGHARFVLENLTSYFNDQDAKFAGANKNPETDGELIVQQTDYSCDELRHTEGTVILHITFAAKQNPDLNREVVRMLKVYQYAPGKILSPFYFALSLSLTQVHRYCDQIMDLLKNASLKCFKEGLFCQQSKWINDMVAQHSDIHRVVMEIVENSKFGWDYVIQGLVQFGFLLMDSCGPKASFGRITESSVIQHSDSPNNKMCMLGADILLATFQAHESVRSEILEQLLNRIVTHASSPITQYVDLLGRTVHASPQLLLDSSLQVREVLDYISFMPAVSSRQLLVSLLPLFKVSMPLKDSLMLVLRKALFSRQLESRKVAVNGFLLLLKHFKVIGSLPSMGSQSSQSSASSISQFWIQADVHFKSNYNSLTNEALCLELLGTLRRCLQQQSEVKQLLYTGVYEVIKKNSMLTSSVLSLLTQQLLKYYVSDKDIQPPLRLGDCFDVQQDKVELKEPLAHLIAILQLCVTTTQENNDDNLNEDAIIALSESEKILKSLCHRIAVAELEDFELDKSAEFNSSATNGSKNHHKAQLLSGIYDSMMEYSFMTGDFSLDSCRTTLELFKNKAKLKDVVENTSANSGKKKDKDASNVLNESSKKGSGDRKHVSSVFKSPCLYSFNFLSAISRALFNDSFPDHQQSLKILREDNDFMSHIISSTSSKLQQLKDSRRSDSSYDRLFQMLCTIGRALFKFYTSQVESSDGDNIKISSQCLETFCKVLTTVAVRFNKSLNDFITSLGSRHDKDKSSSVNVDDNQEHMMRFIKKIQGLIILIISGDADDRIKEIPSLISIITALQPFVTSSTLTQIHGWIKALCKDNETDDSNSVKSFVMVLLNVSRLTGNVSNVIRDICRDMHSKRGDIDSDVQVESCNYYKIISGSCISSIIAILMSCVENLLEDCDWILTRMKAELTTCLSDEDKTKREGQENAMCIQLGTLTIGLYELVQTSLPNGPWIESLLKLLAHFYNRMTNFIKYNISKITSTSGGLSTKLEKLVKLSGSRLSPMVYSMINYIQGPQKQSNSDKKRKRTDSETDKAKVIKETKGIPTLIFSIEQNERFLIQLSKKSKVNLMAHVKLSTARDFRINQETIDTAFDKYDDDDNGSVSHHTADETINNSSVAQKESEASSSKSKSTSSAVVVESTTTDLQQPVKCALKDVNGTIERTDKDNSMMKPPTQEPVRHGKVRKVDRLSTSSSGGTRSGMNKTLRKKVDTPRENPKKRTLGMRR